VRAGYLAVGLYREADGRKDWSVHDLVLSAFVGPKPTGWQADHISRNGLDNRQVNLRYVTPAQNSQNKATTLLTLPQVVEIKRALRDGARKKDIAAEFGISRQMVRAIEVGRTWKVA
jgi:HNH endonuclease